jgi:hypothetical protein
MPCPCCGFGNPGPLTAIVAFPIKNTGGPVLGPPEDVYIEHYLFPIRSSMSATAVSLTHVRS